MNRTLFLIICTITVLTIGTVNALGASSDADSVVSKVIHTAKTSLAVNQTGQIGDQVSGSSFTYYANPTKDYLRDASLILGNAADNLSWGIYRKTQPAPSPANPYGPMLPMSDLTIDSTSNSKYRVAFGKGTNRDSTIGFDVAYYAPKEIYYGDFYIAEFKIYKGIKDSLGAYYPLMIAFAADWDIPSDSARNNSGGCENWQTLYQRGETSAVMQQQFGAVTAYREKDYFHYEDPIQGGFFWDNLTHVYPFSGFQADSIWKYTTQANGFACPTPITDLSSVLVIGTNLRIDGAAHDTLEFYLLLSGQLNGSPKGLQNTIHHALVFFCTFIRELSCPIFDCIDCGNANGDGSLDVADVVFLISFIFNGGFPPEDCPYPYALGDANGDGYVDISDAVFLIAYIFSGGPAPHCQ
jgi:hypothetical protein